MPADPKVDDEVRSERGTNDLTHHYETMRAVALADGVARAGLGAALVVAQGLAAWMRGWEACTPPARPPAVRDRPTTPSDVIGVLAAMALACTGGA